MMFGMTRFIIAILTLALCAGAAAGLQANPLRDRLLRNALMAASAASEPCRAAQPLTAY